MASVIHADLELWLTGYIRRELALRPEAYAAGVFVSDEFPSPAKPRTVVVRYDGGPDTSVVTAEAAVGVTILAANKQEAANLSRLVAAIIRDCARVEPGNPVAAVLGVNGPYKAPEESTQSRRYLTATLSVVGQPL
ncbi:hypothetical protein [Arthrobacter agilis]|uniref:hypothetical protein n=1 Tax=Arthrobacter agilis TaxID=37921 RepID=UPI00277FD94C|nr:hypothetical protein [Arthrobacter agilis]MDQ0735331.1 hypothetical protein [Arthrobacter agilis]